MEISIRIVVFVVIIMIVALVLITIFMSGISIVGPITDPKGNCLNTGVSTFCTTKTLPMTWEITKVKGDQTCAGLVGAGELMSGIRSQCPSLCPNLAITYGNPNINPPTPLTIVC